MVQSYHLISRRRLKLDVLLSPFTGKGGANISELQARSGARLQLSRASEFFPGTQERVMLASGTVNQVLTALHLILTKIQGEQVRAVALPAAPGGHDVFMTDSFLHTTC